MRSSGVSPKLFGHVRPKTFTKSPPKGISPIIATVILVGFVVGLSGVFINFYGPFQKARQAEVEEKGAQEVECSFASIGFTKDEVVYNITPTAPINDTVNVTVDNTGTVDLYNFEITLWISGNSYTYTPTTGSQRNTSNPLAAGDRNVFITNISSTDHSGTFQSVRVLAKNCPRTAKKVDI